MKKLIFAAITFIVVAISTKALEPVRIGLNYPNPSGSLTVQLVDVSNGNVLTTQTVNDVSANNSGVVSLVVGENDPDWSNQSSSLTSNPSVMIRVFDQGVFIKQFVFRDLVTTQASTGNGDILDDGFNSTGGLTTSGETADDFLFGAQAIPFGGFGGFVEGTEETKFFFKNNLGALRAGAVDGTSWDTTSLGQYSTGFGFNTEASGNSAFAAGNENVATGDYSTALGFYNSATGEASLAAGSDTDADGDYSSAFGIGTSAQSFAEFAIGSYNTEFDGEEGTPRLFVVGNGIDGDGIIRSDAFEVFYNGDTRIHNDLEVDNDAFISGALEADGIIADGSLEVDGVQYPGSGASGGQVIMYNSESGDAEWDNLPPLTIYKDSTLTGDGSFETPLGVDLTASNTWSGATTFSDDLSLTEASFTGNGNQALYTDVNGLVTAGSGETVQNAAGIYAGTAAWSTGNTLTISETAVNSSSIITITYVGNDASYTFRVDNIVDNTSFDVITDSQIDPTGTIHYMIINQ
ncbi:MAG: hypothetical protein ACE364_10705 [Chlorobiota bacterium]